MKEFLSLKLLDRFRRFFEKLGIDYPVMRLIVQVKLTMDGRRVPTIFNQSSIKKQGGTNDSNSFKKSLWFYGLTGLIAVPFIFVGSNYLFQMSFVFGILMFMVMTSMISDFSSVLLDIRDRMIIGSKPVGHRTAAMAKTVHICIYLFMLTAAVSAGSLAAALVKHGPGFFLVFVLGIVLMDVLIVALTALVYIAVLTFFDGEKLKDIINGVQIALTFAVMVAYQLVGRSFEVLRLDIVFQPEWWQAFVPPIWFGALFEWLLHGNRETIVVSLSLFAIIVPVAAIWIYFRLIPVFEKSLQKLAVGGKKKEQGSGMFMRAVSGWICSGKEERAFFRFASGMMGNERDFKLKVYPSLGFSILFPFIFMFNSWKDKGWDGIASSKLYLGMYLCAIMIPSVLIMLKHSVSYKGAWIYGAAPVSDAMPILKGTVKAFLVKLFLPLFVLESILFILLFGMKIVPDLVAIGLGMLLYTVICFRTIGIALPFSEPFGTAPQQGRYLILPLLLLIAVYTGIHWVISLFTGGLYIYILLLIVLDIIVWRTGFRIPWEKLKN